jgi:hypothetical protein
MFGLFLFAKNTLWGICFYPFFGKNGVLDKSKETSLKYAELIFKIMKK